MSCMKKIYSLLISLTMVCIILVSPASAIGTDCSQQMSENVVSAETLAMIEELYGERAKLAHDFEGNKLQIENIDKQLATLGVEEIQYNELIEKLGCVSPRWNVSSTSTIEWTSVRTNTVYRGNGLELQIIRGIPKTVANELISTPSVAPQAASSAKATTNVLKIGAVCAIENLPAIGSSIGIVHTLYDMLNGVIDGLTPMSIVSVSNLNYDLCMVSHEIYVFVKPQGYADLGHQVLCYSGNSIDYTCEVSNKTPIEVDGDVKSNVVSKIYADVIMSPYYNNYTSISCENFWNYYYLQKDFDSSYKLIALNLDGIAKNLVVPTPQSYPILSIS